MNKGIFFGVCLLAVALSGCSSPEQPATPAPETPVTTGSTPSAEPTTAATVAVGMDTAQVKEIKGAPDDSKHEHGAGGAELDIWIYKDAKVTFENGKVSKIE